MPFQKIYEVNFSNFYLQPHINPLGWPSMQLSPGYNTHMAAAYANPAGIILQIKRDLNASGMVTNNVFVVPTGGIPMHARILVQVEFDLPQALGFPLGAAGTFSGPGMSSFGGHRTRGTHGNVGSRPEHAALDQTFGPDPDPGWGLGSGYTLPEPWGLALNISPRSDMNNPQVAAKVTCQFLRRPNQHGVRLNTPGGLQPDQPTMLEEPLDYTRYQAQAAPHIPRFLLEHSFCGWPSRLEANHVPGCGFLTIARKLSPPAVDHRVYSFPPLEETLNSPSTHIRALGISLATLEGIGWISVRLRSFTVWRN